MESSFSDEEKRFVLAEMVKYSHIDVNTLVDFIKYHEVQPDWMSFHLPRGRNMKQCIHAAEVMFNAHVPPPTISPLKRRSIGDISEHAPKRQAIASPGEMSPYLIPRAVNAHPGAASQQQQYQHHHQQQQQQQQQQPINIQPRPNGYPSSNQPPPMPAAAVAPTARRRGRPPKAESSRQNNQIRIMPYQPITPAPLAPSPRAATAPTAPQPHSPGPGPLSLYQISPGGSLSDPKLKRKGHQEGSDQYLPPESVPRAAQRSTPSNEDVGYHRHQAPASESEYHTEWREAARSHREDQLRRSSGPILLEPPLTPHSNPGLHPPLSPHPPPSPHHSTLGMGHQAREASTTTEIQRTHRESHSAVTSA
ncbi:hypothetical protein V8F06_000833 [Rhypophila decipiens]